MEPYLLEIEEIVGTIYRKEVRDEILAVIGRLSLMGISPSESVILISKLWQNILSELYYPVKD